ncbi:hypothetical protein JVU11DRAFT_5289 [Chiua virens]|nr:hypothetical protein JVU11DRAFT_5289 [Chiua virens]
MPRSEIDDIFAGSVPPPKKKFKTSSSEQKKVPSKSRQPETVLDSSKKPVSQTRRRQKKHTKADDLRFTDSRGSAPRVSLFSLSPMSSSSSKGRKTVDGYNIYKEDELAISTAGGGQ